MSDVSKPHFELYSQVDNDAPKVSSAVTIALKICAEQNWIKTQPKTFFFLTEFKTYGTLELVR
jgi:hypothetical protein